MFSAKNFKSRSMLGAGSVGSMCQVRMDKFLRKRLFWILDAADT